MGEEERCVLFVDDEIEILNSIKRQLRKENFTTFTAIGGKEALNKLSSREFQIILTDERMPDMNGIKLLQKVKALYPDTVRIILSGYADTTSVINAINHGEVYRFISKPWEKAKLIDVIDDAFARYNTQQNNKAYMKKIIEENRMLQKKLDLRNTALKINRDILNLVPQPIVAVTEAGYAELVNDKSSLLFRDEFTPGIHLKELLSEETGERIMETLKSPSGQSSFEIEHNSKKVKVYTRALRPQDPYKGLVIFEL